MQEINDELMMPCAQCARKHLSAAIAHYVTAASRDDMLQPPEYEILMARAMINLCEATEGYDSHLPYAIGLYVMAEEECGEPLKRNAIRSFRLAVTSGKWDPVPAAVYPTGLAWHLAHVAEAEREFPGIVTAVVPEPRRGNESDAELRQAEVNYRLAQLKWLDENVFGYQPKEKGEEQMATKKANPFAKKGAKADPKAAKKAACKGGKCKGKCK